MGHQGLKLDPAARIVTVDGREVHLTGREFDLLYFLISHPNRGVQPVRLLRQVWDYDFEGYDRTVDAHVARLRRKLGAPGGWIETAGHRLQVSPAGRLKTANLCVAFVVRPATLRHAWRSLLLRLDLRRRRPGWNTRDDCDNESGIIIHPG